MLFESLSLNVMEEPIKNSSAEKESEGRPAVFFKVEKGRSGDLTDVETN